MAKMVAQTLMLALTLLMRTDGPGYSVRHAHLDEPGREEWEGFSTGTRAAAAGADSVHRHAENML